jgi:4-alpha-glucanotransferase
MLINFQLNFSTQFGQHIFVTGNCAELGNNDISKAIPLQYVDENYWKTSLQFDVNTLKNEVFYQYILKQNGENDVLEFSADKFVDNKTTEKNELFFVDTWNAMGAVENVYFTQPFKQVFFKQNYSAKTNVDNASFTHQFKVRASALQKDEKICILGSGSSFKNWQNKNPVVLTNNNKNWWTVKVKFSTNEFPIAYKYGVYNETLKKVTSLEAGADKILSQPVVKNQFCYIHDGFVNIPFSAWKGAGVAIPVFSLRSKQSFGTGEFTDIKLLVDWAKKTGLKLIQLLPINDTTASHTKNDSYPYAAISAFALHPLYLNLQVVAGTQNELTITTENKLQQQLNSLPDVDYEQVMKIKLALIKKLFLLKKELLKIDTAYQIFFNTNQHWLVPYAAFCYLRDENKTADFTTWKFNSVYDEKVIAKLVNPSQLHYNEIAIHFFTQYHLHLQLTDATKYAHENSIVLKGDLPIGIFRNSVDAWMQPALYNMNAQAGAPPDDFAIKGQNWGFPTYNWATMQKDNFAWWQQRFTQMSNYFDAFRIDHILGFFRIWSIPLHEVEGIMGQFKPALPVAINEFYERGISFTDTSRFTEPFVNEEILYQIFGDKIADVKEQFFDGYVLKQAFNTQQKVAHFFAKNNDTQSSIKNGLFDIISNVLLFKNDNEEGFHFRFGIAETSSFKYLDLYTQQKLNELYIDYFFKRQDNFWRKEALNKLPILKQSTNMLICGEDLGMVPYCVPAVMQQLGILSLEIQRMPKKEGTDFFHPNDAPYLSVVTPSTHDMSTIRGWWQEDTNKTNQFYNHVMGKQGTAPFYCEPWINKEIVLQHLYSPAMWSIFQLQDILGISQKLRRENPDEERINQPANPNHYWRYRMHIDLEDLLNEQDFNEELKNQVTHSGR